MFSLSDLAIYLSANFTKTNGHKYTVSDVQGYIKRGKLPKNIGGQSIKIKTISNKKFYQIINKNGKNKD